MIKKSRTLLGVMAVMMMFTTVFSGCGSGNSSTVATTQVSTQPSTQGTSQAEATQKSVKPITFTAFYNGAWYTFPEWGKNEVSKLAQEKTGVTLEFLKPNADDNQQFNLMIASNDMPDFVINDQKNPTFKKAIRAGLYEDLGALIDQYAPEMRTRLGDSYFTMNAFEDGKNYCFYNCEIRPSNFDKFLPVGTWNPAALVRQDIYEALGKPKIDTPEDLLNVLTQVKQKYPNIMPIMSGIQGTAKVNFLGQPFGYMYMLAQFGNEMFYDKDNKLLAPYKAPTYLPALKWINKLYNAGIIKRGDLAITDEQLKAIKESGNCFYLIDQVNTGYYIPPNKKDVKYIYAPMFQDAKIMQQDSLAWAGWSITKKCKDKARAVQFMSWCVSDEGEKLFTWGPDKYWKMDGDMPVRSDVYNQAIKDDPTNFGTKTGIGSYWFNSDMYDHWISANTMQSNPEQKEALDLYLPHASIKVHFLSTMVDPVLPEALILQKAKTEYEKAFPIWVMAKTDADLEKLYNDFIKKTDDMGMPKVEDVWSKNAENTRAAFKDVTK